MAKQVTRHEIRMTGGELRRIILAAVSGAPDSATIEITSDENAMGVWDIDPKMNVVVSWNVNQENGDDQ